MAEPFHEEGLSSEAKNFHRAIVSLIEELEAVNWYNQRADVTDDQELKGILLHNRDEEVEHACMALEWIRRKTPVFDTNLRTYLFTEGSVTDIEDAETSSGESSPAPAKSSSGDLGIKSLRKGD
ncbi:MAG: ferritin-like domain-containing protein [Candidatus Auribacterota bacterium]|jgi:ferritin-like protein|uniref:Ferritin n=1 Tax=Candidatus Auribacter fodinae TaxID=2093366 RepID=A0A3A4QPX5_9BACT|nr:MAG: ferritin [Candidatus Auribacter fodinae]